MTLDAMRRWRFKPARQDGKPIAVIYKMSVNFGTVWNDPQRRNPESVGGAL